MTSFTTVMREHTDAELLDVLASPDDHYRPEALEAAREEAARRRLSAADLETAAARQVDTATARETEPLDFVWLLLFVFMPMVFLVASWPAEAMLRRDGYTAKAHRLMVMRRPLLVLLALAFVAILAGVLR